MPVELWDISVPIFPGMPVYPGDPDVEFETASAISEGEVANVTRLHLGSQTGTHYDAPHHILNDQRTLMDYPLSRYYGDAAVVAIDESVQAIDAAILEAAGVPPGCTRLLLKTRNSRFWETSPTEFRKDFAALTPDGAKWLVERGIQLIAVDYLSVELFNSEDLGAHHMLLNGDVIILEGVNLAAVEPGEYTFMAFPIRYEGLDGAPTRAVLAR